MSEQININISEARELFAKTTQGRCIVRNQSCVHQGAMKVVETNCDQGKLYEVVAWAEFISSAHNNWLAILDTIERQKKEIERLWEFARNVRDNWDCDSDGHKYGTGCRCCNVEALIGKKGGRMMYSWLRRRWFVGILSLRVASSRFLFPPLSLDWEGAFGPFDIEQEAVDFASKMRGLESE